MCSAIGKARQALQQHVNTRPESLTSYIDSRFLLLRENADALPHEERDLLQRAQTFKAIADSVWRDEYESKRAHKRHVQEYVRLQEFYVLYHAEGIIVTAASSMVKILRGFRPDLILMDEASQLHEHTAVAVISRFFRRC